MDDLDSALARLAAAPVPAALDSMGDRVLTRIAHRPSSRQAGVGIAAVAVVALTLGMLGSEWPATAAPAPSLAPLGGASPLIPSALLVSEP